MIKEEGENPHQNGEMVEELSIGLSETGEEKQAANDLKKLRKWLITIRWFRKHFRDGVASFELFYDAHFVH